MKVVIFKTSCFLYLCSLGSQDSLCWLFQNMPFFWQVNAAKSETQRTTCLDVQKARCMGTYLHLHVVVLVIWYFYLRCHIDAAASRSMEVGGAEWQEQDEVGAQRQMPRLAVPVNSWASLGNQTLLSSRFFVCKMRRFRWRFSKSPFDLYYFVFRTVLITFLLQECVLYVFCTDIK